MRGVSRFFSAVIVLACAGIACKGESGPNEETTPTPARVPEPSDSPSAEPSPASPKREPVIERIEKVEGPIPTWCSIDTRVVSAIETDRRTMCDSMWGESPDWCMMKTEPWFEVLDWEHGQGMTLYIPRGDNRGARLPMLSEYLEGSEEAVYPVDRKIWSTEPLYAWLLMQEGSDLAPDGFWVALAHIVARSLDHGTFLVTDVRIDIKEAYGVDATCCAAAFKDHPAAGVDLVGDQIDVWACGGHVRLPLPEAAKERSSPTD
jgi:hypothetical protein